MDAIHGRIKRPRPSLNCVQCRKRKVKCSKEQPACNQCVRLNHSCHYDKTFKAATRHPTDPADRAHSPSGGRIHNDSTNDGESGVINRSSSSRGTAGNELRQEMLLPIHNLLPTPWSSNSPDQWPTSQTAASTSNPPLSNKSTTGITSGQLHVLAGDELFYVSPGYWGYVAGNERLSRRSLGKEIPRSDHIPPSHVDANSMAAALLNLPEKATCDILLECFIQGVRPLYPLIHLPTFRREYDDFWHWCRNVDITLPTTELLDNPTWICLLFAVLYCGAVTPSAELHSDGWFQQTRERAVAAQLRKDVTLTLVACQHIRHPTMCTVITSLLVQTCSNEDDDPVSDIEFVCSIASTARRMGLHTETNPTVFDGVTRELRRRIWWHIIELDIRNSCLHGCPTNIPTSDCIPLMASTAQDDDISRTNTIGLSSTNISRSPVMTLCNARWQTAKFQHWLVNQNLGVTRHHGGLKQRTTELFDSLKQCMHCLSVDHGLATASIQSPTNIASVRASTFKSFASMVVSMLLLDTAILLQMVGAHTEDRAVIEEQLISKSATTLKLFLSLLLDNKFGTYRWYLVGFPSSLRSAFLLSIMSPHDRLVADVLGALDSLATETPSMLSRRIPQAWSRLKSLREELKVEHQSEFNPSIMIEPTRCWIPQLEYLKAKASVSSASDTPRDASSSFMGYNIAKPSKEDFTVNDLSLFLNDFGEDTWPLFVGNAIGGLSTPESINVDRNS